MNLFDLLIVLTPLFLIVHYLGRIAFILEKIAKQMKGGEDNA